MEAAAGRESEPVSPEPAVAEPVVADEQTLRPEEIPELKVAYPGAEDLLNLLATGGPGKRIFTEEELHFYSKAIKIYTENTVKALDLLFPTVSNDMTSGTAQGKLPLLNNDIVGELPNIPFYNNRIKNGTDVQGILQSVVLVITEPPYPDSPKDLKEVAQILINGVKRIDDKSEGIIDDKFMFERIKEKILKEIPDDDRRRKLIEKIDNAMGFVDKMFTDLQYYAQQRKPWSTELHNFMNVGRQPDLSDLPDIPFELRVDVPSSEGESQPPEPQSPVRPAHEADPAPAASAVDMIVYGERRCRDDSDCFPDAPNCGEDGFCSGARAMVGGKRKRKHKRTRKTHKLKHKHSKLKKSHKRKKTLKRKYKKTKKKSKRR